MQLYPNYSNPNSLAGNIIFRKDFLIWSEKVFIGRYVIRTLRIQNPWLHASFKPSARKQAVRFGSSRSVLSSVTLAVSEVFSFSEFAAILDHVPFFLAVMQVFWNLLPFDLDHDRILFATSFSAVLFLPHQTLNKGLGSTKIEKTAEFWKNLITHTRIYYAVAII